MNLWLANPRGFCAGVDRAVRIVEELIAFADKPVYVCHEIVHNRAVVVALRARGAVFVESIEEIPPEAPTVISAHGAAPQVFEQAKTARLRVFDATCPLVTKVHLEVVKHARAGRAVIVIGHRDHVEVIGTIGHYGHYANGQGGGIYVVENEDEARAVEVSDPAQLAYVTQTTLAVEASMRIVNVLRARFPLLLGPHHDDICYATQNRQGAVRMLSERCTHVLVIGALHSSNSMRMVEVARECGVAAHLIEGAADIDASWFASAHDVGLTSSASAPERLVAEAVEHMRTVVPDMAVRDLGAPEHVTFKLPAALLDLRTRRAPQTSQVQPASASF